MVTVTVAAVAAASCWAAGKAGAGGEHLAAYYPDKYVQKAPAATTAAAVAAAAAAAAAARFFLELICHLPSFVAKTMLMPPISFGGRARTSFHGSFSVYARLRKPVLSAILVEIGMAGAARTTTSGGAAEVRLFSPSRRRAFGALDRDAPFRAPPDFWRVLLAAGVTSPDEAAVG